VALELDNDFFHVIHYETMMSEDIMWTNRNILLDLENCNEIIYYRRNYSTAKVSLNEKQ
jgi:hypothetical protein